VKGGALIVLAALLAPLPAWSQTLEDYDYENLQFRGIGLEGGMVVPWNLEPDVSWGVRSDLGMVGPNVRIMPAVRYWSSRLKDDEVESLAEQFIEICDRRSPGNCPSTLELGEVRRSDLELALDAHIVPDVPSLLRPYAGGGFSLHLLNGGGESIDNTFVEDLLDTLAPGVNLLAGVGLPIGPLEILIEGRLSATSDIQYGNFVLGGVWTLPTAPAPASVGGAP
jgi:hypothetical protein